MMLHILIKHFSLHHNGELTELGPLDSCPFFTQIADQTQVIISGFSDQVQIGNTLIELLDNGFTELTRADEDLVFYAYEEFSRAEKTTLNILIVKAGITEQVPMVGPPVAAVLRQVKEVVASISNTLIQNIQSRAKDFESEAKSLGDTLDLAISKYDGLAQAQ
ncbi:hypothetical protein VE04_00089 [Pseudogymnoascus sp. 24MN13]|nr:hypothetical protein VE04_00089 [Pseudogymnoascus sp. 24MN13]